MSGNLFSLNLLFFMELLLLFLLFLVKEALCKPFLHFVIALAAYTAIKSLWHNIEISMEPEIEIEHTLKMGKP